jgi:hypothetical protein
MWNDGNENVTDQGDEKPLKPNAAQVEKTPSQFDVHQEVAELYIDIIRKVGWLFCAAMRAVIEKRVNLEFFELIRENQLFDADIVSQYGLTATQFEVHEYEVEVKGVICGAEAYPNPYQHIMGPFSAEFIHDDDGYSLYRYWTSDELDQLLDGIYLYDLPATTEQIEILNEIKAWLDGFVMMVKLSQDRRAS